MRHERAVSPPPHVDLEYVRPALDRGRERPQRVLWRACGVAAMSDAERLGDGAS
jgi:hypothetical protein